VGGDGGSQLRSLLLRLGMISVLYLGRVLGPVGGHGWSQLQSLLLRLRMISVLYLGRVLGPVGGDGGSQLQSLLLRPGVDIRNIHLDGIQVCKCTVCIRVS
jgi:hypothetical protein